MGCRSCQVYTHPDLQTEPTDRDPVNPGWQCQPVEALAPQSTRDLAWGPSTR